MATWNQPGVAGSPITAALLNELRTNYKTPETAVAFSPAYSATVNVSAVGESIPDVFGARITQLRSAINTLESKMSVNCNCNNCCQTCQACQGCQSCQACQTSSQCSTTCQSHAQCTVKNCVCNCQCQCDCTCFLEGTLVLMADGFYKPIQSIKPGEMVVGLGGNNKVISQVITRLGNQRSVWRFVDDSLFFSGEHPFWIRANGREQFGTHDYTSYTREQRYGVVDGQKYLGLTKTQIYLIAEPVEYAHTIGWKKNMATIDRSFGDDTKLFNLEVGGSHTFVVNNYLVSGELRDDDYNFSGQMWVPPIIRRTIGNGC